MPTQPQRVREIPWPSVIIASASAPPGQPFEIVVPEATRWRLVALRFIMETGEYENEVPSHWRHVSIQGIAPVNHIFYEMPAGIPQGDNEEIVYSISLGHGSIDRGEAGITIIPCPTDLWLMPGFRLKVYAQNMTEHDRFKDVALLVHEQVSPPFEDIRVLE